MPIVRIDMLEGRTPEVKRTLIRRVTEVVAETLSVQPEQVRILLSEIQLEHWGTSGISMAERRQLAAGNGSEESNASEKLDNAPLDEETIREITQRG
ncbi:MAG TPA: 2-hydroxymuconate tautomerase family protein [Chloroflexia bacterium]|nr:2-hydroxymuconate tautomerase family protein [Chloroflexia bacterium]